VSERRVCQVVGITRSTKRRSPGRIEEVKWVARLHELSGQYPRFGYRRIFVLLKNDGWSVGRERLRLLRRREGLRVPQKHPKRRRRGSSTTEPATTAVGGASRSNHKRTGEMDARKGVAANLYDRWSRDFLEAGKKHQPASAIRKPRNATPNEFREGTSSAGAPRIQPVATGSKPVPEKSVSES
jgi:hypothetical protein